jgi:hypothetical protein
MMRNESEKNKILIKEMKKLLTNPLKMMKL